MRLARRSLPIAAAVILLGLLMSALPSGVARGQGAEPCYKCISGNKYAICLDELPSGWNNCEQLSGSSGCILWGGACYSSE